MYKQDELIFLDNHKKEIDSPNLDLSEFSDKVWRYFKYKAGVEERANAYLKIILSLCYLKNVPLQVFYSKRDKSYRIYLKQSQESDPYYIWTFSNEPPNRSFKELLESFKLPSKVVDYCVESWEDHPSVY